MLKATSFIFVLRRDAYRVHQALLEPVVSLSDSKSMGRTLRCRGNDPVSEEFDYSFQSREP